MKRNKDKSLSQLIGQWKSEIPKEGYSSSVQLRTYELYFKKIEEYDLDDIRFMLIQQQGMKYLIPIALNYLEKDLLTEAGYYEGDVLSSVLSADKAFWVKNLKLYNEVYQVLLTNKDKLSSLNPKYEADRNLLKHCDQFLKELIT